MVFFFVFVVLFCLYFFFLFLCVFFLWKMSFVTDSSFTHILRVCNTNIDGRQKVIYGLRRIKGVGRRFATLVCKKADIDTTRRAGELKPDEVEKIVAVLQNPQEFKIPVWMLNRQRDIIDGTNTQLIANNIESKLREDLERMKKMKMHRGLRHAWHLRVRGQHTKTTGRHGRTVGVSKKKSD